MTSLTSRQRVLAYLRKQRHASAAQIGRGLNLSAAAVRHHLSILLADERVARLGPDRARRRGRPVQMYGLSEKSLGDNLAWLADRDFERLAAAAVASAPAQAMRALAPSLVRAWGDQRPRAAMAQQLSGLVERLNLLHYQAGWEAGAAGPRLLLNHCPYAAIIARHPELCQLDAALLSEGSGLPARQLSKIGREGSLVCVFALGPVRNS